MNKERSIRNTFFRQSHKMGVVGEENYLRPFRQI
jgi:hypothetical protein